MKIVLCDIDGTHPLSCPRVPYQVITWSINVELSTNVQVRRRKCPRFSYYFQSRSQEAFKQEMKRDPRWHAQYRISSRWALGAKMTSYRRRCDVIASTLIRRHITSCARWYSLLACDVSFEDFIIDRHCCSSRSRVN